MNSILVGELLVTLAPLEELRAEAARLAAEAAGLHESASQHRTEAMSRLAEAGMILVAREGEWLPQHPDAAGPMGAAREAIRRVDEVGGLPEEPDGKRRFALFARKKDTEAPEVRAEREARAAQLRKALVELGRDFGEALAAVSTAHDRALDMQARAEADLDQAAELQRQAFVLLAETENRARSVGEMGFDAPLLAATLQETGVPAVTSPLQLRADEVAYLAEPAELARDRNYAINAPPATGLAPPLAVSGIPFTTGKHRGQALSRNHLSMLGPGVFVVTNQRLGFVGKLKSFSFSLTDLVAVEQYNDGLSLQREGRDNADVLISAGASRILFFINWALRPGS